MSIVGIGIDIVQTSRIGNVVGKYGEKFLRRAFHPKEIEQYRNRSGQRAVEYLASRLDPN